MLGQTCEKISAKNLQRKLRESMTDAERALWNVLRGRRFTGVKFRRQHPFTEYILDFVCLEKGLVIEVDGSQHLDHLAYDQARTEALQAAGFVVIRFTNLEVLQELESVKERIWLELQER